MPSPGGVILPGEGEHRSRSQREIDGLHELVEGLGQQNRKLFAIVTALTHRFGPIINLTPDEIDAHLDPTGRADRFCGFAVKKGVGSVILFTREMEGVVATMLSEEIRKAEAAAAATNPTAPPQDPA